MKKLLIGTTALVAAAAFGAQDADAKDIKLKVGGFLNAGVAVGPNNARDLEGGQDEDPRTEAFNIVRDGEIHFKAKGTLDNGITISARVELEAVTQEDSDGGTTGDQIDENWVRVSTAYGDIMVGGNDDAAENLKSGVIKWGVSGQRLRDADYLFTPGDNFDEFFGDDDIGIHYYSPNLFGFEFGVSYQPSTDTDGADDDNSITDTGDYQNRTVFSARYKNKIGGVKFAINGAYGRDFTSEDDFPGKEQGYAVGVEAKVPAFGGDVSAFFRYEREEEIETDEVDQDHFTGGVKYETGPWEFVAFGGFAEEAGNDAGIETQEYFIVGVGGGYELGDGVKLGWDVNYGESDIADERSGVGASLLLGIKF
ncbi:MAG: porin [Pseudomonadota bacterium]